MPDLSSQALTGAMWKNIYVHKNNAGLKRRENYICVKGKELCVISVKVIHEKYRVGLGSVFFMIAFYLVGYIQKWHSCFHAVIKFTLF